MIIHKYLISMINNKLIKNSKTNYVPFHREITIFLIVIALFTHIGVLFQEKDSSLFAEQMLS